MSALKAGPASWNAPALQHVDGQKSVLRDEHDAEGNVVHQERREAVNTIKLIQRTRPGQVAHQIVPANSACIISQMLYPRNHSK